MIHFENVGKRYPAGREALSGVNFRLEKGEMAVLQLPTARQHRGGSEEHVADTAQD